MGDININKTSIGILLEIRYCMWLNSHEIEEIVGGKTKSIDFLIDLGSRPNSKNY
jgi:hypothetical protein